MQHLKHMTDRLLENKIDVQERINSNKPCSELLNFKLQNIGNSSNSQRFDLFNKHQVNKTVKTPQIIKILTPHD